MAYPPKNLKGRRFGRLKVISFLERNEHSNSKWLCRCDCGNETEAYYQHLTRGEKKSCGKCGLVKRGVKPKKK